MAEPTKYIHLVERFELKEFQEARRLQVVAKCGFRFSPTVFGSKLNMPVCPDCFYRPQYSIAA